MHICFCSALHFLIGLGGLHFTIYISAIKRNTQFFPLKCVLHCGNNLSFCSFSLLVSMPSQFTVGSLYLNCQINEHLGMWCRLRPFAQLDLRIGWFSGCCYICCKIVGLRYNLWLQYLSIRESLDVFSLRYPYFTSISSSIIQSVLGHVTFFWNFPWPWMMNLGLISQTFSLLKHGPNAMCFSS